VIYPAFNYPLLQAEEAATMADHGSSFFMTTVRLAKKLPWGCCDTLARLTGWHIDCAQEII
jgi:hypothetical protein